MTTSSKPVMCVVWDLDNTLWDGVLLEGDNVSLRPEIVARFHRWPDCPDVIRSASGATICSTVPSATS